MEEKYAETEVNTNGKKTRRTNGTAKQRLSANFGFGRPPPPVAANSKVQRLKTPSNTMPRTLHTGTESAGAIESLAQKITKS